MKRVPPFYKLTPAEMWAYLQGDTTFLGGINFGEHLPYRLCYELEHTDAYASNLQLGQELGTIMLNWQVGRWPAYVQHNEPLRCGQLQTFAHSAGEPVTGVLLHHVETHFALARMAHGWGTRATGSQFDEIWRARNRAALLDIPSPGETEADRKSVV